MVSGGTIREHEGRREKGYEHEQNIRSPPRTERSSQLVL
jgi:hypothetical protein